MRGPFRNALALAFLLLAVFMAAPVYKPFLWILDEWGRFHTPFGVWPALFLAGSISLYRAQRPRSIRLALMGSFILLGTVAAAAYLTQGWNGFTVLAAAFMYYCGRLNLDIKAGMQEPV